MPVKVHKWGNSSAVPVPAHVKEALGLYNGAEVEIEVEGDKMIVKPVKEEDELTQLIEETISEYDTAFKNLIDR